MWKRFQITRPQSSREFGGTQPAGRKGVLTGLSSTQFLWTVLLAGSDAVLSLSFSNRGTLHAEQVFVMIFIPFFRDAAQTCGVKCVGVFVEMTRFAALDG